jgi:hypothetical protein
MIYVDASFVVVIPLAASHAPEERINRPADQKGGGGRMQDRRLGNVVDRAKHSLGNLQKAGFDVAYEKEVYGLFADNEPRAIGRHGSEPLS